MKLNLGLSIIAFVLTATAFPQSDCKYNGDYNAILSAVKSKNPTSGKDKLTEDHLKSIAKYWELDCKCKNGVETIEEANELRREAFDNKDHFTSSFIDSHGNNYHKDMSNFGDLEPPFVPFLASSCLRGANSTGGMSLESGTDCAPEASRLSELDGQLSAYAGQFFVAYCQCKNGVPSQEYADNLIATMQSTHKSFTDFKNAATAPLSTQPLNSCEIVAGADYGNVNEPLSQQNFGEIMTGDQLSNDLTTFIGALAQDTDNPGLVALANEMAENQQSIDQIKADASIFGPLDQSSIEFLNMAENVMQAVSIGKAIFGGSKQQEVQLSPSQEAVRKNMGALSRKLRLVYDEVAAVPFYYTFNKKTLKELEELEQRTLNYESATAKARLIYFTYIDMEGYPSIEEMNSVQDKINAMSNSQAVAEVASIQSNYKTDNIPHITNADRGFAGTRDKITLYKARCYEKTGNKKMAEQLRKTLKFNVPINDAIKLTLEAYDQKDFYATTKYAQVIQDYFQNESYVLPMYPDLMSVNFNFEGLYRSDINYLMTLGVLSYAKSNQLTQANLALDALVNFHATFETTYESYKDKKARKKAFGLSNEEFRLEMLRSKAMMQAAKAYVESKNGNNEKALDLINDAIAMYKEAPEIAFQKYELWYLYNKLEILVNLENYEEARDISREIKIKSRLPIANSTVFNKEDSNLDFINAYIRFKTEDYNGALMAIKMLKKKKPKSPKAYALEEEVYLAMNNEDAAELSYNNYIKMINQKQ